MTVYSERQYYDMQGRVHVAPIGILPIFSRLHLTQDKVEVAHLIWILGRIIVRWRAKKRMRKCGIVTRSPFKLALEVYPFNGLYALSSLFLDIIIS